MTTFTRIDQKPKIRVNMEPLRFPSYIEGQVDELWTTANRKKNYNLQDNSILVFSGYENGIIEARVCQYKYYYAQHYIPGLYSVLGLNSLAVSGVVICSEGVVLAKRGLEVLQDAGLFELVPSGSVELKDLGGQKNILEEQLLSELEEEIGLREIDLYKIEVIGLVNDFSSHVVDVVYELRTNLSARQIKNRWNQTSMTEYVKVCVIPMVALKILSFMLKKHFVETSRKIIYKFNLKR